MENRPPGEAVEAGAFFQRPQFNAYERLVCSHLIEAGKSDQPLQTVIHTCLAGLTLDKDTQKRLEIDKSRVESLYTVSQRLLVAAPVKDGDEPPTYQVDLGTLNWARDIAPWIKLIGYRHWVRGKKDEEDDEEMEKSEKRYFHYANQTLTVSGYNNLVSDFLIYSIPICQDMSRKLSTLISPETFTELLKVYHGERPQS